MTEELDVLLDQLKKDDSLSSMVAQQSAKKVDVNDENINDFIMQKAGKLIEDGVDAVDALKQTILSSFEPTELSAYSDLIKSVVKAIDTMNKINLQNKKDKSQKELKEMDLTARKELPDATTNTNILIATREDIMKNFLKEVDKKSIDITFEEEQEQEQEEEEQEDEK